MTKNITDGNFDQNFEEGSATINIELHPSLVDLTGRSTYQVGWKIDPTNPSNYIQLQNESGNDTLNEKNFLLDFEVSLFENNDNELFYYELYNVRKPLNVSYQQLNTGNAFEDTFSSTCTGQEMSITFDLATNFINQTSEPPVCGQLATTILYPNGLKEDNQFVSIYGQSPNEIKVEDISGEMTIRYNSISPERNEYAAIIELDHGEVVSIEFEKNDVNWDEYEVGDLNTEISQLSSSSLMVTSFVLILFLRKIKSRK